MADTRLPPQNIEAEESVLGALLLDKDAIVKVAGVISSDQFYKSSYGDIYKAILRLYEKRQPTDMVTVTSELKKMNLLKTIGGAGKLTDLVNAVPTAAHIEHYANIVKEMYIRRQLISASGKIAEMSYNDDKELEELVDEAEQTVFGVSQGTSGSYLEPISTTLEKAFDKLDELHRSPEKIRGVPTGFKTLDKKLAGLQDSNLVIIAARPSVGKTSFMLNIAQYASVVKKIPVAIFSLESSKEQLVYRMLAAQANVDNWRITTGKLEDEDFTNIGTAMGELADAPMFIDDTPGDSVMSIRTKARRLHMEYNIKMILIDYLQLSCARNLENRVQEVSEISKGFKNIARELNIPVIVLSQLSRSIEQRGKEARPQLSDLRDSGSIEQDADVVAFLYRADSDDRNQIKLLIAKHRNGPTGEIDYFFKAEQTRFYELEDQKEE